MENSFVEAGSQKETHLTLCRRSCEMRSQGLLARRTLPGRMALIEWPKDEGEPTKYWFSTLPVGTLLSRLVHMAKHRWIIQRDFEKLKQELGLGHFEGRG